MRRERPSYALAARLGLATALAGGTLLGCGGAEPVAYETPNATVGAGAPGLQVAPSPTATTEDEIREEIREELGDEGLDAEAIAILVEGNNVTLRGEVRSIGEVERARRVAADVEGVEYVDVNQLAVRRVEPQQRLR